MATDLALNDLFNTQDNTKWLYGAAAAVSGGRLVLTPNTTYTGTVKSVTNYNFTGMQVSAELVQRANNLNSVATYFKAYQSSGSDTANAVGFVVTGTVLQAVRNVGGAETIIVAPTYNATNHRFLRIRHDAGVFYWETSANGTAWTALTSWTPTWAVTSMKVILGAGYWDAAQTAVGTATWDNVNPTGAAPPAFAGPTLPNTVSASTIAGTTPGGKAVYRYEVTTQTGQSAGSRQAFVYIAATGQNPGTTQKAVLLAHGGDGNGDNMAGDGSAGNPGEGQGAVRALVNRLLDAGYVVISPSYGNSAGNLEAMARATAARNYLYANWTITGLALHGFSMGGGAALTMLARQPFPVSVAYIVAPLTDLAYTGENAANTGTWGQAIVLGAYNATTANVRTLTAAHDPMQATLDKWAGKRIRMNVSPDDTAVPVATYMTPFRNRAQQTATELVYVTTSGGHTSASEWESPATVVTWMNAALASTAVRNTASASTATRPLLSARTSASVRNTTSGAFVNRPLLSSSAGGGAGGGVLATETFTVADGSPWPSPWVTTLSTTTNTGADVQGGKGRLYTRSNSWAKARHLGTPDAADGGMLATVTLPDQGEYANGELYFQLSANAGTDYRPGTGMSVVFYIGQGRNGSFTQLVRSVNGVHQNIGYNEMPAGLNGATTWKMRFEREGAEIRMRMWAPAAAEPTTWLIKNSDPNEVPVSVGKTGIALKSNSGDPMPVLVDDVEIYVPGQVAAPAPTAAIVRPARSAATATRALISTAAAVNVRGATSATTATRALISTAAAVTVRGATSATTATRPLISTAAAVAVRPALAPTTATRPLISTAAAVVVRGATLATTAGRVTLAQATPLAARSAFSPTTATRPAPAALLTVSIRSAASAATATRPLISTAAAVVPLGARALITATRPLISTAAAVALRPAVAGTSATRPLISTAAAVTVRPARAGTSASRPLISTAAAVTVRSARAVPTATRPLISTAAAVLVRGLASPTGAARPLISTAAAVLARPALVPSTATRPLAAQATPLAVRPAAAGTSATQPSPGSLLTLGVADVYARPSATRPRLTSQTSLTVRPARSGSTGTRPLLSNAAAVNARAAVAPTSATRPLPVSSTGLAVRSVRVATSATRPRPGQTAPPLEVRSAGSPATATQPRLTLRHVVVARPARAVPQAARPALLQRSDAVVDQAVSGSRVARPALLQRSDAVVRPAQAPTTVQVAALVFALSLATLGVRVGTRAEDVLPTHHSILTVRPARAPAQGDLVRFSVSVSPSAPPSRTLVVPSDARLYLVPDDLRRYHVPADARMTPAD